MGCTDSRQLHHQQQQHGYSSNNSKAPGDTTSTTTRTASPSLSISVKNLGDCEKSVGDLTSSQTSGSSLSMSSSLDWRRDRPGACDLSLADCREDEDFAESDDEAAAAASATTSRGINYPGVPCSAAGGGGAFASVDVTQQQQQRRRRAIFHENMSLADLSEVAPLDHGGFCVVCSCVYRGQRAVLKVPKPQGPEGAAADLLTEISIYKRVAEQGGHPNIAHAYGSGFHLQQGQQTPFLVLERLDGGSLAKALERSRPAYDVWSDPVGRLPVALELADALAFLHNEAVPGGFVLHRDLKPTNIGLCALGHVKVFDLGLSVLREVRDRNTDKYQLSGMAGSKRFMAPEVCNGLPYNEKVDVYSFAVVLWEICTLRKPFAGMSVADHYREVIVGGLRPPLDPRWPPRLISLLQACWHGDPDRRPFIADARDTLREIFVAGGGSPML